MAVAYVVDKLQIAFLCRECECTREQVGSRCRFHFRMDLAVDSDFLVKLRTCGNGAAADTVPLPQLCCDKKQVSCFCYCSDGNGDELMSFAEPFINHTEDVGFFAGIVLAQRAQIFVCLEFLSLGAEVCSLRSINPRASQYVSGADLHQ